MARELDMSRLYQYFDLDSVETCFTKDFRFLTKYCGPEFIEYCILSWAANVLNTKEGIPGAFMTEEEWMKYHADMPRGFFEKKIKPDIDQCLVSGDKNDN